MLKEVEGSIESCNDPPVSVRGLLGKEIGYRDVVLGVLKTAAHTTTCIRRR